MINLKSSTVLMVMPLVAFAASKIALADTAPSPYQLSLMYMGEDWYNTEGGLRTGNSYMNNIDAKFSVDTAKAFGWTGGQFVAEGWYENAVSTGSKFVGAVDQQSPIDTAWDQSMFRLYQLYYDQNIASTGTDLRFGIYDLETEFSTTKPMTLFLSKDLTWNTAFDQSGTMPQNGNVGPGNYPYTPLAFRVRQDVNKDWSVQVAITNGVADGQPQAPFNQAHNDLYFASRYGELGIAEADYTPSKYTKVMLGTWGITGLLPTNNELDKHGNPISQYGQEGGYIGAAARLYSQDERRGLDGFFTFGYSDPTDTNVAESLNGGFTYTGLFDARPMDKAGISFNVNAASGSYQRANAPLENYETSFEATYRARLTDWLTLQPDIQYIIDPGFNPALKNDLIVGMHFEIGHLFNL